MYFLHLILPFILIAICSPLMEAASHCGRTVYTPKNCSLVFEGEHHEFEKSHNMHYEQLALMSIVILKLDVLDAKGEKATIHFMKEAFQAEINTKIDVKAHCTDEQDINENQLVSLKGVNGYYRIIGGEGDISEGGATIDEYKEDTLKIDPSAIFVEWFPEEATSEFN